jgi:RNA polymerase sigma-70 factor (ECF subfamily)
MSQKYIYSDEKIIELLTSDDKGAMEVLFNQYYGDLCGVVYRMINDRALAEDLVQEVFYNLWKNRARININSSVRAYLKRSAVNRTLNHIRDNKKKTASSLDDIPPGDQSKNDTDSHDQMEFDELQMKVEDAVNSLPPRCRMVFVLSRYEQLSHREISIKLEISEKTVENQIGKALKVLREQLKTYL